MSRLRALNDIQAEGKCVLYVMSRDQRVTANHALAAAQSDALEKKLPLAVVFTLYQMKGSVAREHYEFILEGLKDVEAELARKNIPFIMLIGPSQQTLTGMIHHTQPASIYFDFNPLRGPRNLHQMIADTHDVQCYEIDTHNIVPVWDAYHKQAYGARILRPHIHRLAPDYWYLPQIKKHPHTWPGAVKSIGELGARIDELVKQLPQNHTSWTTRPGQKSAKHALNQFLTTRLRGYADDRNDASRDALSGLSPYLHFGQLSSLQVLSAAKEALSEDDSLQSGYDTLFEEMVVRKELSDNYCFYNQNYDTYDGLPDWAKKTLEKHADDPREHEYSRQQLEAAETHDEAWNAAQCQLTRTGKIHGYMRMYWAKKVLEWSLSATVAIEHLVYLNDFYHLDGRDPNGYVGILWSVGGLHDRPWGERPIFGTVRYMVQSGLRRKFDIEKYIQQNY